MTKENNKITFVGAGTMGCYNALIAALAGYRTVINDRNELSLQLAQERVRDIAKQLAPHRGLTEEQLNQAFDRITTEVDLGKAVAGAKLVSESVFESLQVKQVLHAQLDSLCDADTLLTTNTSSLLPSDIELNVTGRTRFAALHSYLASPLVDIVGGSETSAQTITELKDYVESLGGVPLVMKCEYPGYGLNAMLGPLLAVALGSVTCGYSTLESVDRAWINKLKAPMGPFGMMDMFGLDMVCDSWRNRLAKFPQEALAQQVVAYFESHLNRGELGMKSGRGFYSYPNPVYGSEHFSRADEQTDGLFVVLMSSVIASACLLVSRDVMSADEVDLCWTVGMGLSLAPFTYIQQQGAETFLSELCDIQALAPIMSNDDFSEVENWLKTQISGHERSGE